jgi:uncharacterized protein (DUF2384 family)
MTSLEERINDLCNAAADVFGRYERFAKPEMPTPSPGSPDKQPIRVLSDHAGSISVLADKCESLTQRLRDFASRCDF